MSTTTDRYYQSSGDIPFHATPLMFAAGVIVAVIVSLPLVLIAAMADRVIIAMACSLGIGALAGLTVRGISRLTQVRHPDFVRFVGLVVGVLAVFFAWVWFVWALNEFNMVVLRDRLTHPLNIFEDMNELAAVGLWSIFDYTPRGWELYGFWIAEAVSIIVLATVTSADDSESFCEPCQRWTKDSGILLHLPRTGVDELRHNLEQEQYGILDTLRRESCDMDDRFDLAIAECPKCQLTNFLTIQRVKMGRDSENRPEKTTESLITNLIVPRDLVEHLRLPAFEGSPDYDAQPIESPQEELASV